MTSEIDPELEQAGRRLKSTLDSIEAVAIVERKEAEDRQDFKALHDIREAVKEKTIDARRAYEDAIIGLARQKQDQAEDDAQSRARGEA